MHSSFVSLAPQVMFCGVCLTALSERAAVQARFGRHPLLAISTFLSKSLSTIWSGAVSL